MISVTPLYVSAKGGSITCLKGEAGRVFRCCSASRCVYTNDLHSAKVHLDNLEFSKRLSAQKIEEIHFQRKTTLKWNPDGELSEVDMARILDRLSDPELKECDLACDYF